MFKALLRYTTAQLTTISHTNHCAPNNLESHKVDPTNALLPEPYFKLSVRWTKSTNHRLVAYTMPNIISANFGALSGLSDLKGRKKKTSSGPDQVAER